MQPEKKFQLNERIQLARLFKEAARLKALEIKLVEQADKKDWSVKKMMKSNTRKELKKQLEILNKKISASFKRIKKLI